MQGPLAPQPPPFWSRQLSDGQHDWPPVAQVCPTLTQVAVWQTPVPVIGSTAQPRPVQQSAGLTQAPPTGWHTIDVPQTPPWQISEQHWAETVHACPVATHVPASVGTRQAPPMQSLPAQHWPLPLHALPTGVHSGLEHEAIPVSPGTHRAPLQH